MFGLTLLAHSIGWKDTRALMHWHKRGEESEPSVAPAGAVNPPRSEH